MLRLTFLTSLLSLALVACGGDDGNGGGGSGVDSDKAVSELSGDEITDLCEWSNGLIDVGAAQRFTCLATGILNAEQNPDADCQMFVDECLANPDDSIGQADCAEAAAEGAPDCPDVTVGEFEACIAAQADFISDQADSLTCESSSEGLFDLPPACMSLQEACPEAFGSAASRQAAGQPVHSVLELAARR